MTHGKRRFNDPRYTDYKLYVRLHAQKVMDGRAPFTDAVKISVTIVTKYRPTSLRAGDIDNHLKAILDALNGTCFVDDRQIIEGHVYLCKGEPHVEVTLEELK